MMACNSRAREGQSAIYFDFYRKFISDLGLDSACLRSEVCAPEVLIPHTALRKMIQSDPSTDSILSSIDYRIAPGRFEDSPCRIDDLGLILISGALLGDSRAVACAVRWGIEARFLREWVPAGSIPLVGLLSMVRGLMQGLPPSSRALLLEVVPALHREHLTTSAPAPNSLYAWLASMMGWSAPFVDDLGDDFDQALCQPLEAILVSGGDSRLLLDATTLRNRYGVPARPRPEAIHFSSSTASAISHYGFMLCEMLRRDLLVSWYRRQDSLEAIRARVAHASGVSILDALGLEEKDADVAVLPSGTDAELVAVTVSAAGEAVEAMVNVLIGPEESGRGVALAAGGCRFDELTYSGQSTVRGELVLSRCAIEVRTVPIRGPDGMPRDSEAVDQEFMETVAAGIRGSGHVLAHVLLSSKTGLSAPTIEATDSLVARAQEQVDVVVDACQVRAPLEQLGQLVRKGWMVQVSGSKFLTGPPFSGALVVPSRFRSRAKAVGRLVSQSAGISHHTDWTRAWSDAMSDSEWPSAGFGPLFRWLPALLEAAMLAQLPEDRRRQLFERFRQDLLQVIGSSELLTPLSTERTDVQAEPDHFLSLSIISFQVHARRADGSLSPMDETECQCLFQYLNSDVSGQLPDLKQSEKGLARLQVHLGQPVTLKTSAGPICVLRFVLGARFFTFVGHAEPDTMEAAFQSELGDAKRAIEKIELLANNWSNIISPDASRT